MTFAKRGDHDRLHEMLQVIGEPARRRELLNEVRDVKGRVLMSALTACPGAAAVRGLQSLPRGGRLGAAGRRRQRRRRRPQWLGRPFGGSA